MTDEDGCLALSFHQKRAIVNIETRCVWEWEGDSIAIARKGEKGFSNE